LKGRAFRAAKLLLVHRHDASHRAARALNASANRDTITDFNHVAEHAAIAFATLTNKPVLAANDFQVI
jgi:hypothetical protein